MDISGNPYAIYPGDLNHIIKEGVVFVDSFVFSNYTDGEHRCRIIDRAGRDIFDVKGSLDLSPISIAPGSLPFHDLFVSQLDSGVLYIYIR